MLLAASQQLATLRGLFLSEATFTASFGTITRRRIATLSSKRDVTAGHICDSRPLSIRAQILSLFGDNAPANWPSALGPLAASLLIACNGARVFFSTNDSPCLLSAAAALEWRCQSTAGYSAWL